MSTPASPGASSQASPTTAYPSHKPNPHPYAIKTTSTALLARSNSSGHNLEAQKYNYVPLSPSPSPHRRSSASDEYKGHRFTTSLTAESAPSRPLPVPPKNGVNHDSNGTGVRIKRADTFSTLPIPNTSPTLPPLEDLPSNPKLWTPSQLSSYLITALRVRSGVGGESEGAKLPERVAKDVAAFVKESRISGRTFLRLNETDLESMGVNQLWRSALLIASRNLRQNVLRGRIWGFDSSSPPSPPSPSPPSAPFSTSLFNSSTSSLDLSETEEIALSRKGAMKVKTGKNGRVKGMVETFERKRSESFGSSSSIDDGEDRPRRLNRGSDVSSASEAEDQRRTKINIHARPLPRPPPSSEEGEEEPSMESLLLQAGGGVTGARAWEEMDDEGGITVKRVPGDGGAVALDTIVLPKAGSGRLKGSSGSGKGREERRVVTAIFSPDSSARTEVEVESPSETLANSQLEIDINIKADEELKYDQPETEIPIPPVEAPPASLNHTQEPDPLKLKLELELERTRTLLEITQTRLSTLEKKLSQMEEEAALREDRLGRDRQALESERRHLSSERDKLTRSKTLARRRSSLFSRTLRRFLPSTSTRNDKPDPSDMTVSDLPSYVLLVGLGVCAVVLKVVLGRVGGRRR